MTTPYRTAHPIGPGRDPDATLITAVLALPCGLACAGSVVPGLDDIVTTALVRLAALGLVVLVVWRVARWVRERREDAADTLAAAHWRAAHAPHLLTATERARLGIHPMVAGLDVRAVA
jgi:hypothetical protein